MRKVLHKHIQRMHQVRRERPAMFWARVAMIGGIASLFVLERSIWTPDTLFVLFLAVFVALGQTRAFLIRFAPFLLLLFAYDSFRSIADDLNHSVHFMTMPNFDMLVFGGHLPTATLQSWLWHGSLQWYDFYFYFLYTVHFLAPVLLAILIWKLHPHLYWRYVVALVGLSFAAFIVFILFPAAPPWMASDMHYIAPIHRISTDIWYAMGVHDFSEFYSKLSPNAVAAVPSLHSAYPWLFTLFVWRMFSFRRAWWVALYPVSMWFGVVYLGEHYVFDVVLGVAFATIAYAATMWAFNALRTYHPKFKSDYQRGYAYAHAAVSSRRK